MITWKMKNINNKMIRVNVTPRPFTSTYITTGINKRYDTLQERLIRYLKANGLTVKEFATYMQQAAWREHMTRKRHWVSFTYSGVYNWVRGYCSPTEGREALMCKYMGVSKEWLRGFVPLNSVNYTDGTSPIWDLRDNNAA